MFKGCIGDIRVYRPSSGQLDKVKLRKSPISSPNAQDTCLGACSKVGCYNGGRCIDRIWHSECDCSATGFEGHRCENRKTKFKVCLYLLWLCSHGIPDAFSSSRKFVRSVHTEPR